MTLNEARETQWDYIVIGTGIGGSTLGYKLAQQSKRVLFLEKGHHLGLIRGLFPEPELQSFELPTIADRERLKQFGRYSEDVIDETAATPKRFIPLLGQGVGGSTLLYGAALERFFPEDFEPERYFHSAKEASLQNWPISYEDLAPYYEQAENLYQVYGSADPLRSAHQNPQLLQADFTNEGHILKAKLQKLGLHPYRLPVGHKPDALTACRGCQAFICGCADKSDAGRIATLPAMQTGYASLLADCEALHFECDGDHVRTVVARQNSNIVKLKATTFILGAGVLNTTRILLRSKNQHHPCGLGNSSGLIGKNLCRHYMDLIMLHHAPRSASGRYEKEIALNDFYFQGDMKLGTIQSLGNPPGFETMLHEMHSEIGQGGRLRDRLFYSTLKRFGRRPVEWLFKKRICLAMIMEDVSYEDNRVYLNAAGELALQYRIRDHEMNRLATFRGLALSSFRSLFPTLHKQGENNQRLAHASGTCRMGDDPQRSVVDRYNRLHDVSNLYVIDASFFPSSAGINPALTIAANALRVGDHLLTPTSPLQTN